MARSEIPVYDIRSISQHTVQKNLLIERLAPYLTTHYEHLHHAHRHSFYHLVMFTRGAGSHTIDFVKFAVEPSQLYFMIPGQVHSWHFKGDVDGFIVHFDKSLFSEFLRDQDYPEGFSFFQGVATDSICTLTAEYRNEAVKIFEDMLKEINGNPDLIRIRLMELFIIADRACPKDSAKPVAPQKLILLKSFTSLIDRHYRELKMPKEYAELIYVTPNHLNALCRDLLGKSAGDLIRERVLLEAKRMLTNLDMSVAGIANDLGFQDNSYFNRFFKKNVGSTPDEFRKNFLK